MSDHRIFVTFRIEKENRDKLVEPEGIMSLSNMRKSREWIQVVLFLNPSVTVNEGEHMRETFIDLLESWFLIAAPHLLSRLL